MKRIFTTLMFCAATASFLYYFFFKSGWLLLYNYSSLFYRALTRFFVLKNKTQVMEKSTRFALSVLANGNIWLKKSLFIIGLLVLLWCSGYSQTTTTYTQQTANYPATFTSGGGS